MAFFLRLTLWASLVFLSSSELVIDVQPNVISPEITPQLVINCSITNNQVQHLEVIKSLTLSRYNETIKGFDDLFVLNSSTLDLKQLKKLTFSQISFGNIYITLTLHNPSQFDANVYRCNATGDNAEGTNISLFAKKKVEFEINSTAFIEEIRRLKKDNNSCQLSSTRQKSRLQFEGSSEIIRELIEPLTLNCSFKLLNNDHQETPTLQSLFILHEAKGVIAYINKGRSVITAIEEGKSKKVKGEIYFNNLKDSYLQVTWRNLKISDSGKYVCEAHVQYLEGRSEKFNEMLKITVQIPTLGDLVNVIQKLITQADEDKESIQVTKQNIENIKEDLNTNNQNIKRIREEIDTNKQNIESIEVNMDNNITMLREDIFTNAQNINGIHEVLDTKTQIIQNLSVDINRNTQTIKQITLNINTNITRLKEIVDKNVLIIKNMKVDLDTNITMLKKDIDTNSNNIKTLRVNMNANISKLNEDVDTNKQKINKFQEDLEITKSNISTDLIDLKNNIEEVTKSHKNMDTSLSLCRNIKSFEDRATVMLSSGLKVMCDTKTDGGGWIIFQRRINGEVDFYRGWKEYRDGFGDYSSGEFYLGNENIFNLTSTGQYDLRIDLKSNNKPYFAQYKDFKVLSETEKYKLQIGKYSGNAGDSLSYNNNMFFSTFDRDNDKNSGNCAQDLLSGWWYNVCSHSDLNRKRGDMYWERLPGGSYISSFSEMKIRKIE